MENEGEERRGRVVVGVEEDKDMVKVGGRT